MNNSDNRLPKVLQGRGFDYELIKDYFVHGTPRDPEGAIFRIDGVSVQYFSRGDHHCRMHGRYSGLCWYLADQVLEQNDVVYVATNILHAFTLLHLGEKAIATFSAFNFPKKFIEENREKNITYQFCALSYMENSFIIAKMVKKCHAMGVNASLTLLPTLYDYRSISADDLFKANSTGKFFMTNPALEEN